MQAESTFDKSQDGRNAFEMILPAGDSLGQRIAGSGSWVRAVGFIAKPEKTNELTSCIEESVKGLLQEMQGFAGVIVLNSQDEGRNLLVLTFWETAPQARLNQWEKSKAVRKVIAPLVDVCTKVQTFRATANGCGRADAKADGVGATI